MVNFLLDLLRDIASYGTRTGWNSLRAIEAIEQPATNPDSQRYRTAALWLFAIAVPSSISAAVVWLMFGQCVAFDLLGFGSLFIVAACIRCGVRCAILNEASQASAPDDS